MFDLGPLGILQWQGSLYFPILVTALVVLFARAVRENRWAFPLSPYFVLFGVTVAGWVLTRYFDTQGFGWAASLNVDPVVFVAILLVALDLFLALLLLQFAGKLLLVRLCVVFYGFMVIFGYAPAAAGWLSGGAALTVVNIIGVAKLLAIIGGASGGSEWIWALDRVSPIRRRFAIAVSRTRTHTTIFN